MASKKHNPGCPCCDEISDCECPNDAGFYSRSFSGTPTVKVVVSGLPSSLDHRYIELGVDPFLQRNVIYDTLITNLDVLNGTYFFEFDKSGNCIIAGDDSVVRSADISIDTSEAFPYSGACAEIFVGNDSGPSGSSVVGGWDRAQLSLLGLTKDWISWEAQQTGLCRNDFIPIIDGLINNGDILFKKLTNDATPCDTRIRSEIVNTVVSVVVGKITYEMLDL